MMTSPYRHNLIDMIEYPFGISRLIIELSIALKENNSLSLFGDTLEKIYLMYLMKKKFNKIWDGKQWTM